MGYPIISKETFVECINTLLDMDQKEGKLTSFFQEFDPAGDVAWLGIYSKERQVLFDLLGAVMDPPEDEDYGTIIERYVYDYYSQEGEGPKHTPEDLYDYIVKEHLKKAKESIRSFFETND